MYIRVCFRLLAILIVSLGLFMIGQRASAAEAELETARVKQMAVPQLRTVDATIEAVQQATVSAQTGGRITEINVDVDDYVTKGTILLRMRDKDQRSRFDAAKARFDEANAEFVRVKEIYAKKLVAKAMLDKAQARYRSARAELEQAKESLEHTLVRAPYSGIVVKRHVEVGETARVGQKLVTGLSLEKLRAIVELPQSLIHQVRKHQLAWVWLGAHLEQRVKAESLTISPFADPNSHTFLVRINLSAGEHHVYPGMHTRVAFLSGEKSAMVVPVKSIVKRSEVTGVYVKKDNHLSFRYVRLGKRVNPEFTEILSGLSIGETVVLDPERALRTMKLPVKTEKE